MYSWWNKDTGQITFLEKTDPLDWFRHDFSEYFKSIFEKLDRMEKDIKEIRERLK